MILLKSSGETQYEIAELQQKCAFHNKKISILLEKWEVTIISVI